MTTPNQDDGLGFVASTPKDDGLGFTASAPDPTSEKTAGAYATQQAQAKTRSGIPPPPQAPTDAATLSAPTDKTGAFDLNGYLDSPQAKKIADDMSTTAMIGPD